MHDWWEMEMGGAVRVCNMVGYYRERVHMPGRFYGGRVQMPGRDLR